MTWGRLSGETETMSATTSSGSSLPECASAAAYPARANTVNNIFHALLPKSVAKSDSVNTLTTVATTTPSDSRSSFPDMTRRRSHSSPPGWSCSSLLESSDDDGTPGHINFQKDMFKRLQGDGHQDGLRSSSLERLRHGQGDRLQGTHCERSPSSRWESFQSIQQESCRSHRQEGCQGSRRASLQRGCREGPESADRVTFQGSCPESFGGSQESVGLKAQIESQSPPQKRAGKSPKAPSDGDSDSAFGDSEKEEEEASRSPERAPVVPSGMRRRSGIQTSHQELFQGLKATFDAMERLDVSSRPRKGSSTADFNGEEELAYIRLLSPADFVKLLQAHHVPVEQYGKGKARCLRDLWAEVVIRECNLERIPDPFMPEAFLLQRRARTLILEVKATVRGADRFLLLKQESNDYGQVRDNLDSRVTKKLFDDEDIPSGVQRCLLQTLGLEFESGSVEDLFEIESAADVEEVRDSMSYPGLRTVYQLHLVYMRVRDIYHPKMVAIGLPSARDFTAQVMGSAVGVGRKRTWRWCTSLVLEEANKANQGIPTSPRRPRRCKTLNQLADE